MPFSIICLKGPQFYILHFTFYIYFEILRLAFYRAPENRNEVRFLGRGGAALQVVHFAQRQNADSMGERRRAQDDKGACRVRRPYHVTLSGAASEKREPRSRTGLPLSFRPRRAESPPSGEILRASASECRRLCRVRNDSLFCTRSLHSLRSVGMTGVA